jgi:predicted RNA-binding protein with PUA-like domain
MEIVLKTIIISSQVVKESYVDHTQFDKADPHYDP